MKKPIPSSEPYRIAQPSATAGALSRWQKARHQDWLIRQTFLEAASLPASRTPPHQ